MGGRSAALPTTKVAKANAVVVVDLEANRGAEAGEEPWIISDPINSVAACPPSLLSRRVKAGDGVRKRLVCCPSPNVARSEHRCPATQRVATHRLLR